MCVIQVASALQLPNESIPFEAPTEEQIAAAALPFQKRARANATTSSSNSGGDSAGDARRMRQMREQTDVDIRLFHHATAMSTAAFRAPSLSPVRRQKNKKTVPKPLREGFCVTWKVKGVSTITF